MTHLTWMKSISKMLSIFKNKHSATFLISSRGKIISDRIFHCPIVVLLDSVPVAGKKFQILFKGKRQIKIKSSIPLYSLDIQSIVNKVLLF